MRFDMNTHPWHYPDCTEIASMVERIPTKAQQTILSPIKTMRIIKIKRTFHELPPLNLYPQWEE